MKWYIERKWTWQDLTAKIKVVTNHRHKVFKKQRTRYHKHENDIGTSAVQDLQKELRQTSALSRTLAEDHTALIRGAATPSQMQTRCSVSETAELAPYQRWTETTVLALPVQASPCICQTSPHVVRGASIITETAAAHSHNPDTTNRPAATDKFTTTSSQKLLSQSWNYTSYRQVMKLIITVAFTNKWITHIMGTDVITCF